MGDCDIEAIYAQHALEVEALRDEMDVLKMLNDGSKSAHVQDVRALEQKLEVQTAEAFQQAQEHEVNEAELRRHAVAAHLQLQEHIATVSDDAQESDRASNIALDLYKEQTDDLYQKQLAAKEQDHAAVVENLERVLAQKQREHTSLMAAKENGLNAAAEATAKIIAQKDEGEAFSIVPSIILS
jgi:hypothetical protein